VRNIAAGHLCSRLGIEEGAALNPPTFEFFLKNDPLHDPMINDSLILTFDWAKPDEIDFMRKQSLKINEVLKPLFLQADLLLVDFKLEFGRHYNAQYSGLSNDQSNAQLILGDEFTPDGCRIWDIHTRRKLDKDRFRKDLGNVVEAYEEVAQRMKIPLPTTPSFTP